MLHATSPSTSSVYCTLYPSDTSVRRTALARSGRSAATGLAFREASSLKCSPMSELCLSLQPLVNQFSALRETAIARVSDRAERLRTRAALLRQHDCISGLSACQFSLNNLRSSITKSSQNVSHVVCHVTIFFVCLARDCYQQTTNGFQLKCIDNEGRY